MEGSLRKVAGVMGPLLDDYVAASGIRPPRAVSEAPTSIRRSLSYGGTDLTFEQEEEVMRFIEFIRERDRERKGRP